jgi:hypothetical protein
MQELINQLTSKAGISADQATKAVDVIKDFVKEKFPMMAGAVDNLFGAETEGTAAAAAPVAEPQKEEGLLDKISNVIPGETGEKVENFVKNAADKVDDVIDNVKDKLSGLFGGGDDKK